MKPARILPLACAALLLGCGDAVKHEFSISPELEKAPIRSLVIMPATFTPKVKRRNPEDFMHMKKDLQVPTAQRLHDAFVKALSASLTVDAAFVVDESTRAWADDIGTDLARNRVPLSVEPHPLAAEAVLIYGVQLFGWEVTSVQLQFLWFKKRGVGPPKVTHNVKLQALLVNPRTGDVLMDALEGQEETAKAGDEELLDRLALSVAAEVAAVIPAVPGSATPPPAATPPTLPSPAPSGTSL